MKRFVEFVILFYLQIQLLVPSGAFVANNSATRCGKPDLLVDTCFSASIRNNPGVRSTCALLHLQSSPSLLDSGQNIAEELGRALNADVDATSELLNTITRLRKTGSQEELAGYLDRMLVVVDQSERPRWTKLRFTSKFSKRSRFASMHRLLNISTPPASDDAADTEETKQSRRRRALVVALNSLIISNSPGDEVSTELLIKKAVHVRKIEYAARKDQKNKTTSVDMESRLPPGLETPKYNVLVKRPDCEIREYESFAICAVPINKPRPAASSTDQKVSQPQLAGASSFGALAGYLFGKNKEQISMKMTTPVLISGEGDEKEMSFVLPSDYWNAESFTNAPSPLENSLVELKQQSGEVRAVVIFGGFASSKEVKRQKKLLLASLQFEKDWSVVPGASATLAQYNDPFTLPRKRRNEVSLPLQAKK